MATAKRVIQIDVVTSPQARRAVQDLNKRLRSIEGNSARAAKSIRRMGTNINFMTVAAKAYVAARFVQAITQTSDSMILLQARIKLVADESKNLNDIMSDLFDTANKTRSSIDGTGQLYQRLALAVRGTGVQHEELLQVVGAVSNALLLSGNSAQESKALMIQLSQALAKGKLDGDEFRSVAENGAVVMDLLAQKLSVTRGELFELSKAGKITREVFFDALSEGAGDLQDKVDELPKTFGQVYTQMANETNRFLQLWQSNFASAADWISDYVVGSFKEMNDSIERERNLIIGFEDVPEQRGKLKGLLGDIELAQKRLSFATGSVTGIFYSDESVAFLEKQVERARQLYRDGLKDAVDTGRELDKLKQTAGELPAFAPQALLGGESSAGKPPDEEKRKKIRKDTLTWQEQYRKSLVDSQTEIERFTEYVNILDNAFFDGLISEDLYLQKLQELTGELKENAIPAVDEFSEAMKTAIAGSVVDSIGSMTDAIVDFAVTGKASFSELASSILSDISKMILKMVVLNALKTAFGGTSIGGFLFPTGTPSFATGTPYVPQDGLAYLHKGERVVPAAQNNSTTNNYINEKPISIVNVTDPTQVAEVMGGSVGENIIINTIRRNPDLVRQVLA